MKRIGFSHNYTKLHGTTKARLVEVEPVDISKVDEAAIFYDTEYWEDDEIRFYHLEPGIYLRLLLMSACGIPFTTYRKFKKENIDKYVNSVGEWFEIFVKERDAK